MKEITITKQYVCFIKDGHIVSKTKSLSKGTHPIKDVYTIEETDDVNVYDSWEIYQEPQPLRYKSDTMISWALSQVFTTDLIPHMAAFLDFANKATKTSKDNFISYANAVGLKETADTLISKAIELGAKLGK